MISDRVGVVVIGRNEGERLIRCLSSIKVAAKHVVYVDSGSTDGSIAAAERQGAIIVRLDLAQPFTAGRARNEGFAALRAADPAIRYVQFVDGDCELIDGWIGSALSFLQSHEDVAVACGRRRERFPDASIYNYLCDQEWNTPIGEAQSCGGDSMMRVVAFTAAGGFRGELMAGEEPELCLRLRANGWKIWRLDQDMTLHDAAMTRFGQWWRRAIRSGYGCADIVWLDGPSRSSVPPSYGRETASAIFWGGLLPLAIIVGSFVRSYVLAAAAIYALQVCRIAFRRGVGSPESWTYAVLTVLAKFAAFYGIAKYWWSRWTKASAQPIEYK
jgi:glycosyltransferase involved in cell wall biosynthesis